MENIIINKAINSQSVRRVAKSDKQVWSLFFDSGLDYLDQLRHRMIYYNVFKAQFGELLQDFNLKMMPGEAFRQILASPHFWSWWSSQLWRVCYNFADETKDEIYIRLMFNTSLIPQSTLKKIFVNEKRQNNGIEQTGMPRGFKHRTQQVC